METATDLLVTIATTSPTWDQQVLLIQQYGRQCAEQALKDAADQCSETEDRRGEHQYYILNTEIITP